MKLLVVASSPAESGSSDALIFHNDRIAERDTSAKLIWRSRSRHKKGCLEALTLQDTKHQEALGLQDSKHQEAMTLQGLAHQKERNTQRKISAELIWRNRLHHKNLAGNRKKKGRHLFYVILLTMLLAMLLAMLLLAK